MPRLKGSQRAVDGLQERKKPRQAPQSCPCPALRRSSSIMDSCSWLPTTRFKLHLQTTPLLEHHGRLIAPTFARVAQQILAHPGWKIKDFDLFGSDDINIVSQWNQKHFFQPESRTMAKIVHQKSLQRLDSLAICAWDGELTYGQLDNITNRFSA